MRAMVARLLHAEDANVSVYFYPISYIYNAFRERKRNDEHKEFV
jgi:hypothetical protein